ncbi:DUF3168 domain-containing protein [Azospirillum agricola]|uniref:DUF3168 domain-containing protein n=1 Tax=Azospirillum agricola TaxID=1720247 RepID=UPI000A0F20E8|nr:DUF3168 domain-containing protein [Azospirillum agricola]SMH30550.1 Protein of unknown function [Azospirillum lipoferum]
MSLAADPLQAALYARLTPAVAPVPVVESMPQGQPYPFVSIGETSATPSTLVDVEAEEHLVTLHVWSDQDYPEANGLLARIRTALHDRPLTVAGFRPARLLFRHSTVFTQPDGVIRHGVIQFRALVLRS